MSEGAITSAPASACTSACRDELTDARVVDDLLPLHQAVMPVARIGIERDIGDEAEIGHRRLQRAARGANEILRVERLRSREVAPGRVGIREEGDRGNAELGRATCRAHSLVHRQTVHPGHGGHRLLRRSPSIRKMGQMRSST